MHTVSVESEIEILKEELAIEKRKLERIKRRSGPKGVGGNTSYLDADAIHADHHHEAMTDLQQAYACKKAIDELEAEIVRLERSVGRIRNCVSSLDETTKKSDLSSRRLRAVIGRYCGGAEFILWVY